MTDIIVEVRKGTVTGLYCDVDDARFVVVDWDLLDRGAARGQLGIEENHAKLTSLPAATRTEYRQAIVA